METFIIATPRNVKIEQLIDMIPERFEREKQSNDRFLISSELHHCWIELDDEIESYYDENEMLIVKKHIPTPKFFNCEFSEMDFGKEILSYIIFDNGFVIDNDHGEILTGGEFLKRLRGKPEWDWRI